MKCLPKESDFNITVKLYRNVFNDMCQEIITRSVLDDTQRIVLNGIMEFSSLGRLSLTDVFEILEAYLCLYKMVTKQVMGTVFLLQV